MITITRRSSKAVVFRSETAKTTSEAVLEAVRAGCDLIYCNLRGVNLSGSDLRDSDLTSCHVQRDLAFS